MKNLLFVVVLLMTTIACVGFYRGWFLYSTGGTDHLSNTTITVDKDKIRADEQKGKEKVEKFGQSFKAHDSPSAP